MNSINTVVVVGGGWFLYAIIIGNSKTNEQEQPKNQKTRTKRE